MSFVLSHRGETFQRAVFEIGTLRSLIPKSVNVMTLTATAINQIISIVTSHLAMDDPMYNNWPKHKQVKHQINK